jgi:hypothetical protein
MLFIKTVHLPPSMLGSYHPIGVFVGWSGDCQLRARVTGERIGQHRRGMGSQP